jgi:hypothetical protein
MKLCVSPLALVWKISDLSVVTAFHRKATSVFSLPNLLCSYDRNIIGVGKALP